MKKRLLSVLLVICMVLTLMPMAAFADTINEVDISFITANLVIGSAKPTATAANAEVEVAWKDSENNEATFTDDGKFAAAGTYSAVLTVTAKTGDDLDGNGVTYKINGTEVDSSNVNVNVITVPVTVAKKTPL